MDRAIRGPRLGAKLFVLMSLALLVIPWFSYRYISEMEDFLVESQSHAQLLTAEGISTLLNGRKDLFYELPISPEGYKQLYAHPLTNPIRIDGKENDWEPVLQYAVPFGEQANKQDEVISEGAQTHFQLLLGEQKDQIYALVQVDDESIVYRDRDILRLDLSDHLRLTFTGQNGEIERIVITATEPGVTTAYSMDEEWRYAVEGGTVKRVQGFMALTDHGYNIEFRMPIDMLGSTKHFGLAVVDVDDPETRTIKSITGTLPSAGSDSFGLVVLKSPEVLRIVEGLGYAGARIQVIDAEGRIRAEVGSYQPDRAQTDENEAKDTWSDLWYSLTRGLLDSIYGLIQSSRQERLEEKEDRVVRESLQGKPSFQWRYDKDSGETIIAGHPIIAEDKIIGTVIVSQNTGRIALLRREALEKIINFTVSYLLIFAALILTFSVRLARRIRKLGAETTNAIDSNGRLRTNQLTSEVGAGDEIGDLARSISAMLSKLHQHNQFLENMPRTLRHEINNPLNTLSTSLQNLEHDDTHDAKLKYLESARRGVMRIGLIVQNLADAANLEEALQDDEFEVIDLQQLVRNYLSNCQAAHPERHFEYRGTHQQVLARVADYRIEQLLDKLVDNAIDFADSGSPIVISLSKDNYNLTLSVANRGPAIPAEMVQSVFDSMVSARLRGTDSRLHFGMGLYVVRVIAQHHGGSVSATNLPNDVGVSIRVTLPLHRELVARTAATG